MKQILPDMKHIVTKIDPYVIAELYYWRSHWPSGQT